MMDVQLILVKLILEHVDVELPIQIQTPTEQPIVTTDVLQILVKQIQEHVDVV